MSQLISQSDRLAFENLFVLELANNHWGKLERGLRIIRDFATVARVNATRVAIKLQFRDVDTFVHPGFKGTSDMRYIKKTESTKLALDEFKILIEEIVKCGCIPMATPFDEQSVSLCKLFDLPIIKVASSDIATWPLLECIAKLRKPVIISTGGAEDKTIDDCVRFFENRNIPLAINHCVSLYPSEDCELELNQIDYLRLRYPSHVIGFSTHEKTDWSNSLLISYAKGARSWERHIDIEMDNVPISPYCALPQQIDIWFKTFHKAKEMCGGSEYSRRTVTEREKLYLEELVRGVYARKELQAGYIFDSETFDEDFYLAIPLHKGQLSCREVINGEQLTAGIGKDEMLTINHIDGPYNQNETLRQTILNRGIQN